MLSCCVAAHGEMHMISSVVVPPRSKNTVMVYSTLLCYSGALICFCQRRIAQSAVCPVLRSFMRPRMIAGFYWTWLTLQTHFGQLLLRPDVVEFLISVSFHAVLPDFFFLFLLVHVQHEETLGPHQFWENTVKPVKRERRFPHCFWVRKFS